MEVPSESFHRSSCDLGTHPPAAIIPFPTLRSAAGERSRERERRTDLGYLVFSLAGKGKKEKKERTCQREDDKEPDGCYLRNSMKDRKDEKDSSSSAIDWERR